MGIGEGGCPWDEQSGIRMAAGSFSVTQVQERVWISDLRSALAESFTEKFGLLT